MNGQESTRRMYSRCTACGAILPLVPGQLAEAGGVVRCGSCGKTFNAVANLFDHPPDEDDQPLPAGGMPPLIAPMARPGEENIDPEPEPGPRLVLDLEPEPVSRQARILWPLAALALLALAVFQVAGPERWRAPIPGLDSAGSRIPPGEVIQIISRDLHPHPTVDRAVVVSAVLVNRGERTIPYPVLEVRLFDASQQPVAQRRFEPAEYLDESDSLDSGMQPDVLLPVVLELATEGTPPAGFQFLFY